MNCLKCDTYVNRSASLAEMLNTESAARIEDAGIIKQLDEYRVFLEAKVKVLETQVMALQDSVPTETTEE